MPGGPDILLFMIMLIIDLSRPSLNAELTYEERAALRRLEREKKRKEREKLAVGK